MLIRVDFVEMSICLSTCRPLDLMSSWFERHGKGRRGKGWKHGQSNFIHGFSVESHINRFLVRYGLDCAFVQVLTGVKEEFLSRALSVSLGPCDKMVGRDSVLISVCFLLHHWFCTTVELAVHTS